MKTTGKFRYFIDEVEIATFDEFEKKTLKLDIKEIKVENLNIYAKTGK